MSKTAQRKRQAYAQGLRDARSGFGFRWARHPHMEQYKAGFSDGQKWNQPKPMTWLEWLRGKFA